MTTISLSLSRQGPVAFQRKCATLLLIGVLNPAASSACTWCQRLCPLASALTQPAIRPGNTLAMQERQGFNAAGSLPATRDTLLCSRTRLVANQAGLKFLEGKTRALIISEFSLVFRSPMSHVKNTDIVVFPSGTEERPRVNRAQH